MSTHRKQQLYYVAADVLSALLVWACFLVFRWLVYDGYILSMKSVVFPIFNFYQPLVLYPLFCLVMYYLSGFYLRPLGKTAGRELLQTVLAAIPIVLGAYFAIIIDDVRSDFHMFYQSLLVLLLLQVCIPYLCRVCVSLLTHAYTRKPESLVIDLPEGSSERDLYQEISRLYPLGKEMYFKPRLYDMLMGKARIQNIDDQPLVCITSLPMSDAAMCVKRAFDVVASAVGLVLLSPLMAGLALAVRCSSKGPVLYRQERIGHFGRPFQILKFRTMYADAEQGVPQLSQDNDPRITPLGHFLRKYRLDELPQLWNILRGDMSIVGPRPERAYFINQITEVAPYYCLIYKVRPGLTSWGPIRVGYTDTLEKMVQRLNYDIIYTESMSLLLDAKILFHTIRVILDGKGK